MQLDIFSFLEMRLGLILAIVPFSIGLGIPHFGKATEAIAETSREDGNTNTGNMRQKSVPVLEWSYLSPLRGGGDFIPDEEPFALASSKHTVQSEIVKRDDKKMKSKKPFYKKYFAELLVAGAVLIFLALLVCLCNFSGKKRRRRARRHETVNSYAKGVVLDPQEFGNGEKKLLEDCKESSSIPYGNSPQLV